MRTPWRTLVGVYALAFAIRLAWILLVQHPLHAVYSDMGGYVDRAEDLMWHLPVPDSRLLTIYPWGAHALFALEFTVLGRHAEVPIAVAHALLGAIPAPCMTLLTARLVANRHLATLAGVLVALWYPQVAFCAFFLSEPWFAAAVAVQAVLTSKDGRKTVGLLGTGLAGAIAFVVRPQFIVTWAIDLARTALASLRRRGLPRAAWTTAVVALPVLLFVGGSAWRLHTLAGRWGLISENDQMTRIWADTDICQLKSSWSLPGGGRLSYWFSPPSKPATKPSDIEEFEGFIADPDILRRIRLRRLQGVSFAELTRRHLHNVGLLFTWNLPWPESNYKDPPWRFALMRTYASALLYGILPLAGIGVALGRKSAALFIAALNVVTCIVCAFFFFGEGRYHVPYDPFFLVLATVGAYELWRRGAAFVRRRRRIAAAAVP